MSEYKIEGSYFGENDIAIAQEEELREFLSTAIKQEPRVFSLISSDSGLLTIGIGMPYGFVQYTQQDHNPPYLVAVEKSGKKSDVYIEFDSGGTPTPIPMDKCIPSSLVIEIVLYFYRNGKIPIYVEWEEI